MQTLTTIILALALAGCHPREPEQNQTRSTSGPAAAQLSQAQGCDTAAIRKQLASEYNFKTSEEAIAYHCELMLTDYGIKINPKQQQGGLALADDSTYFIAASASAVLFAMLYVYIDNKDRVKGVHESLEKMRSTNPELAERIGEQAGRMGSLNDQLVRQSSSQVDQAAVDEMKRLKGEYVKMVEDNVAEFGDDRAAVIEAVEEKFKAFQDNPDKINFDEVRTSVNDFLKERFPQHEKFLQKTDGELTALGEQYEQERKARIAREEKLVTDLTEQDRVLATHELEAEVRKLFDELKAPRSFDDTVTRVEVDALDKAIAENVETLTKLEAEAKGAGDLNALYDQIETAQRELAANEAKRTQLAERFNQKFDDSLKSQAETFKSMHELLQDSKTTGLIARADAFFDHAGEQAQGLKETFKSYLTNLGEEMRILRDIGDKMQVRDSFLAMSADDMRSWIDGNVPETDRKRWKANLKNPDNLKDFYRKQFLKQLNEDLDKTQRQVEEKAGILDASDEVKASKELKKLIDVGKEQKISGGRTLEFGVKPGDRADVESRYYKRAMDPSMRPDVEGRGIPRKVAPLNVDGLDAAKKIKARP